jgi:hypothetical protein
MWVSESIVGVIHKKGIFSSLNHYQQALEAQQSTTESHNRINSIPNFKQSFKMQLTNVFTFISIAIAGVSAMPGRNEGGHPQQPPPPQPPVINHQVVRIYLLLPLVTFEVPSGC